MRDEIVIPFEIDDEIRQLAREATRDATNPSEKVRAIVRTIIGLEGFSLSYDWLSNKTAQEVFREGRGNCLAYSNLFVGMARSVGVDASYADVRFTERITREAEIVVRSTHITAAVRRITGTAIIDFTATPEREYIGFDVIDDLEAIANFYNNQGFLYGYFTEIEDVDFDPLEKELEMYRLALEVLPTFHRARNNLGVALRRRGRIDEAIEQYKLAIEHDPKYAEAHSNLGTAYLHQGRIEEALAGVSPRRPERRPRRLHPPSPGGRVPPAGPVPGGDRAVPQGPVQGAGSGRRPLPPWRVLPAHGGREAERSSSSRRPSRSIPTTSPPGRGWTPLVASGERPRSGQGRSGSRNSTSTSSTTSTVFPLRMAGAKFHSFTVRRAFSSRDVSSPRRREAAPTEPSRRTSTMRTTLSLDPPGPRALRVGRRRGLDDSGRQRLLGRLERGQGAGSLPLGQRGRLEHLDDVRAPSSMAR